MSQLVQGHVWNGQLRAARDAYARGDILCALELLSDAIPEMHDLVARFGRERAIEQTKPQFRRRFPERRSA